MHRNDAMDLQIGSAPCWNSTAWSSPRRRSFRPPSRLWTKPRWSSR